MPVKQLNHRKDHFEKKKEEVKQRGVKFLHSEINYQALLEQIPSITYITALDETGRKLYISPQIESLLGFSPAEWLADPQLWFKQVHPDDRKRVLAEIQSSCANDKPFRSEYRLFTRDGRVVWVRDEGVLVRDEAKEPYYIQGVIYDISKLLRVEEALQESEAKFRAIFEGAAVGIALVNMEGRIIESNPALQEMLGLSGENLRNRIFNTLTHPDDKTADMDLYKELVEGKRYHYQIEKRYIRKDGELIWGRLNVSFVRDAGGEPQFTIHMVEDITEHKRLENHFLQSQKMETVGRLAGGIAHDFNNILTVLGGYSQLTLLGLGENDPMRGNIEEIKKATERAAALTHQLLAFSRRQVLNMRVLDLNMLLRGLEKMLVRIIGEDIQLNIILAEDLGMVKTDRGQIEQVVLNLAVNARDAMPEGGNLTIETMNVTLDEGYTRSHIGIPPGPYVRLSVSDTGCGMPPEVKERVFEPFFTTKGKGQGTGLGLSTVYGIVKQSGGNIWVYSEPGQGTTFKIYLPRVDEEADALPSREETGYLPKGNETVLLVEDEPSVRELAARILREQGYYVLEAANGEEAMHLISEHVKEKIHLLLTDVVMPQMGGKELVEQFRILHPYAKALFISGYTDKVIIQQSGFKSGELFLEKPFSPMELAKKVREVLDK
jgi:two-component system cell cycle sensor histidine kinase/response regulator CckA